MTIEFALYVSSVEGRLVSRLGIKTGQYIGAYRDLTDPSIIVWDTNAIIPISEKEFRLYRREYERALTNRSLIKRSREEWLAQVQV